MFDYLRGRTPSAIDENEYKYFAVMVPLVEKDGRIYVLFEVRSEKLNRQPGEICFPGGKRDGAETSLENAVREASEELLIDPSSIDVIAQMDTLFTAYNNKVSVYLGYLKDYQMTYSRDENEEVFLVPLDFFMENEPKEYINRIVTCPPDDFPYDDVPGGMKYGWRDGKRSVYFYYYEDKVIWGMTAYIMRAVIKTMKKEKPEV